MGADRGRAPDDDRRGSALAPDPPLVPGRSCPGSASGLRTRRTGDPQGRPVVKRAAETGERVQIG